MTHETDPDKNPMTERVGKQEQRMLRSQRAPKRSVWSGFGLFGMVGWSVVVPTLIGAVLGRWLDKVYAPSFSWTLTLLLTGLALGCYAAWHWIKKEDTNMHKHKSDEDT